MQVCLEGGCSVRVLWWCTPGVMSEGLRGWCRCDSVLGRPEIKGIIFQGHTGYGRLRSRLQSVSVANVPHTPPALPVCCPSCSACGSWALPAAEPQHLQVQQGRRPGALADAPGAWLGHPHGDTGGCTHDIALLKTTVFWSLQSGHAVMRIGLHSACSMGVWQRV